MSKIIGTGACLPIFYITFSFNNPQVSVREERTVIAEALNSVLFLHNIQLQTRRNLDTCAMLCITLCQEQDRGQTFSFALSHTHAAKHTWYTDTNACSHNHTTECTHTNTHRSMRSLLLYLGCLLEVD